VKQLSDFAFRAGDSALSRLENSALDIGGFLADKSANFQFETARETIAVSVNAYVEKVIAVALRDGLKRLAGDVTPTVGHFVTVFNNRRGTGLSKQRLLYQFSFTSLGVCVVILHPLHFSRSTISNDTASK
jgi:hypothetical protein